MFFITFVFMPFITLMPFMIFFTFLPFAPFMSFMTFIPEQPYGLTYMLDWVGELDEGSLSCLSEWPSCDAWQS